MDGRAAWSVVGRKRPRRVGLRVVSGCFVIFPSRAAACNRKLGTARLGLRSGRNTAFSAAVWVLRVRIREFPGQGVCLCGEYPPAAPPSRPGAPPACPFPPRREGVPLTATNVCITLPLPFRLKEHAFQAQRERLSGSKTKAEKNNGLWLFTKTCTMKRPKCGIPWQ